MSVANGRVRAYLVGAGFALFSVMAVSIASLLSSAEYIVGFSLAYSSGVSMIFLPCTFPMVLVLVSLVGMSGEVRRALVIALLYGLGVALSMAFIGVSMGSAGVIFGINKGVRIVWAVGGIAALLLALSELGVLRTRMHGFSLDMGRIVRGKSLYIASFLFGIVLGDAGIGCPNPAFFVLVSYIVSVGNVVEGALLGVMHGVGRATPLLFFAVLALLGHVHAAGSLRRMRKTFNTFFNYLFLGIGSFFLSIGIFGGWWCYSALHWAWDNLIVWIGGYSISEQAVPHLELEEVAVGWQLGPWFMTAILAGSVLAARLVERRKSAPSMSREAFIFIASLMAAATLLAITRLPLVSSFSITYGDALVADVGLAVLAIFSVGYAIYAWIRGKKVYVEQDVRGQA